jgi:hypothetical protein
LPAHPLLSLLLAIPTASLVHSEHLDGLFVAPMLLLELEWSVDTATDHFAATMVGKQGGSHTCEHSVSVSLRAF